MEAPPSSVYGGDSSIGNFHHVHKHAFVCFHIATGSIVTLYILLKHSMDFHLWKKVKTLKREVYTLSLAAKDSKVPWYATIVEGLIIG